MTWPKEELARKLTVCRRSFTRKLMCDPSLPLEIVDALWDGPDDLLVSLATPLQVKDRCVVVRYDHRQSSFVLKRHIWGAVSRSARMLLRMPTARRCASLASFLIEQGIPTPRPRSCLVHGMGPFSHRSYLLTDFVKGVSLFHYIRSNTLSTKVVRDLACQVATIWQQFIKLKISHNDLKPENFIVDEALRVWIIDFEKVRLQHDEAQLRRRHLEDARIFLHVRNWRDRPEAAEVFRKELLKTSLGEWLVSSPADEHRLLRHGYSSNELSSRISVAIVAVDRAVERQLLARTIDSVNDLADEIVLVGPSVSNGQFDVRSTVPLNSLIHNQSTEAKVLGATTSIHRKLQHPWVLVLQAGECATPDLVRQLPESIVDQPECDARRIPIDECFLGHSTRRFSHPQHTPIRIFHQDRCRFSLQNGELIISADPDKTVTQNAKIQHHVSSQLDDYVTCLNQQTSRSAAELFQQGQRAHLLGGLALATRHFAKEYVLQGVFRSGWPGLQLALLNAVFVWIREAKLWELQSDRRKSYETTSEPDHGPVADLFEPASLEQAHSRQSRSDIA